MLTLDAAWDQLEAAWRLADQANAWLADHPEEWAALWTQVFATAEGVDRARSTDSFRHDPPTVYLDTAFGVQYRTDLKRWVPFRHGPLELEPLTGLGANGG
jgi:hypothetical protein